MDKVKWARSDVLRFHLKEAHEDLTKLITELETKDVSNAELYSVVAHLYHHLNSGWNSRRYTDINHPDLFEDHKFMELAEFPKDLHPWEFPPDSELEE
ncbi:MAG: hypothetical protein J0L72_10250 [Armatimonadetes bacterium]|nr:hypothetical protein [Armatimonadota bacterium]